MIAFCYTCSSRRFHYRPVPGSIMPTDSLWSLPSPATTSSHRSGGTWSLGINCNTRAVTEWGRSVREGTGAYLGGLVPSPPLEVKNIVLIFNVKNYAKISTLLKMYTWNVPPGTPLFRFLNTPVRMRLLCGIFVSMYVAYFCLFYIVYFICDWLCCSSCEIEQIKIISGRITEQDHCSAVQRETDKIPPEKIPP